jgi:hypothetical protein
MKMTVAEAFRKYKEISIDYIFNNKCPQCGKFFDSIDEEYSFEGGLDEFEDFQKDYSLYDLDDEIEQIEGNRFKYEIYAPDGEICPCCIKENGSSSIVYIPIKTRNREQGTKRIVSALKYTDDIDALAKILGYYPEQLKGDIEALESYILETEGND